jgi:hypothetical protein
MVANEKPNEKWQNTFSQGGHRMQNYKHNKDTREKLRTEDISNKTLQKDTWKEFVENKPNGRRPGRPREKWKEQFQSL